MNCYVNKHSEKKKTFIFRYCMLSLWNIYRGFGFGDIYIWHLVINREAIYFFSYGEKIELNKTQNKWYVVFATNKMVFPFSLLLLLLGRGKKRNGFAWIANGIHCRWNRVVGIPLNLVKNVGRIYNLIISFAREENYSNVKNVIQSNNIIPFVSCFIERLEHSQFEECSK